MQLDELKRRLADEGCSFEEKRVEFPPGSKKYITGLCWTRTVDGKKLTASIHLEADVDGGNVYTSVVKSICVRLKIPLEKFGLGPKAN